jgi:ribonuclease P protein component
LTGAVRTSAFTRARRLDGPHAVAAVFAYKCRVSGKLFQVYAKPNGGGRARLGVVTSKRIMPRAVDRNYGKRLAREVFRVEQGALAGIDLVLRPRAIVARASSGAARAEIRQLLHSVRRQCASRTAPPPSS